MTCCNPFTSKCEGGHGCAAHTTSLSIACCGMADCMDTHCPGRPEPQITDGESNQPWSEIAKLESMVIWIIVWLCAALVFYVCFLAWLSI